MDFDYSPKVRDLQKRLVAFMDEHIYPNEDVFDKEGYDYIRNLSGKFIDYGLMRQEKQTLVLTNQGKMISDNIISELMLPVGN